MYHKIWIYPQPESKDLIIHDVFLEAFKKIMKKAGRTLYIIKSSENIEDLK